MGTRADFYVGRGQKAEWIGSIAMDGYPEGISDAVLAATDEAGFRAALAAMVSDRDDWTPPEAGWPWPWETSDTTDYSYAFDGGIVLTTGNDRWSDGQKTDFPKMDTSRFAKPGSDRSGMIAFWP